MSAAGSLLLAFLVFAALFVPNYQPLQIDPGGAVSGVTGNVQKIGSFVPPGFQTKPFVAYVVPFRAGSIITLGFTVVNREWFPVTVEEMGRLGGDGDTRLLSVRIAPNEGFGSSRPQHMVAFRPFTVTDHGSTYVEVRIQLVHCAGGSLMGAYGLTYRAFGISHHVYLHLPYSLRFTCPN